MMASEQSQPSITTPELPTAQAGMEEQNAVESRTFYYACIGHLLRLDSIVAKFHDRRPAHLQTEGIDIARLILVELLDFVQENFPADEFEHICEALAAVHEQTNTVAEQLQASGWTMFRKAKPDDASPKLDYPGLCQCYCALMAEFYVNCVKRFTCGEYEKKAFLQGAEALIRDLGENW